MFEYRLRESARARHVRLRVTPRHGLEVVVPPGYNPARIPGMLEQKQHWIRAALERASDEGKRRGAGPVWKLPDAIRLPALGQRWQVIAQESAGPRVAVREAGPGRLLIQGRITDEHAGRAALARWLTRQARVHLAPLLGELSRQLGLAYKRVYFRRQRTRWGSCSRHGAISLNAGLLFLEPALVRYVMVHELCHLAEMNHSPRFWSLVRQHHADCRMHDRELRNARQHLPYWLD